MHAMGMGNFLKATWKVSSLHLWQNDLIQFDPIFFEENSNSKAARKPKLLDFVLCFSENGTLGSLGRGKKHDDGTHLMIPPRLTHRVTCFVAEISLKWLTSTKFLVFFMKYQGVHAWYFPWFTKRAVTLRCGLARQDQLSDLSFGPMGWCLGVEFFGGIQKKTRWFSEGFRTNYRNLNRPHVKMCFSKGNLPKHGLNLGWSWKTISNSFFRIFFLGSLHWFHQHPPTIKTFIIGAKERFQWL